MEYFSGRFNFFMLAVRVLVVLIFASIFIFFVSNIEVIANLDIKSDIKIAMWIVIVFILSSAVLIFYNVARDIFVQRFNITFQSDSLLIQNVFTGVKNTLPIKSIKGFSTTDIVSRYKKSHCLLLYFNDEQPKEFPKYLFLNFDQFKQTFNSAGIKYLGHEDYSKNIFGKRSYKFLELPPTNVLPANGA